MTAGSDHLAPESWEQLACADVSDAARARLLAHIELCPACQVIWSALSEVRAQAEGFDPALAGLTVHSDDPERIVRDRARKGQPQNGRTWWNPTWLGVAAGLMLVVGLISFQRGQRDEGAGHRVVPRVSQERAIEDLGPQPLRPAEGDVVTGTIAFAWRVDRAVEHAPADHYAVELLDVEGELVWRSGPVEASQVAWPASVPKPGAGVFYWRVVVSRQGERLTSELVRFETAASD